MKISNIRISYALCLGLVLYVLPGHLYGQDQVDAYTYRYQNNIDSLLTLLKYNAIESSEYLPSHSVLRELEHRIVEDSTSRDYQEYSDCRSILALKEILSKPYDREVSIPTVKMYRDEHVAMYNKMIDALEIYYDVYCIVQEEVSYSKNKDELYQGLLQRDSILFARGVPQAYIYLNSQIEKWAPIKNIMCRID